MKFGDLNLKFISYFGYFTRIVSGVIKRKSPFFVTFEAAEASEISFLCLDDGTRKLAYLLNGTRKNCIYLCGLRKTGIFSNKETLHVEGRNTVKF